MSQKSINILLCINLLVFIAGCAAISAINPSGVTYTNYKIEPLPTSPKFIKPKTTDEKLRNLDTDVRELHNKLLQIETKDKK